MKETIIISEYDQQELYCNYYKVENPKAVIQIIHGMKEHQGRYCDFAAFLNTNGYSVITSDLRGHGKNATILGYMDGAKPWEALVIDQVSITNWVKKKNPETPIYLFCHSMGTIIARNLLQKHDQDYLKVIMSGAPAYQPLSKLGVCMAHYLGLLHSDNYVSPYLESQTLKPFVKSVKNAITSADWLSYNRDNIELYLNDSYCNIPFTISAYKALYHLMNGMHKHSLYEVKFPNKPILMLIGEDDPCPLGFKGLNKSINTLQKAGYQNVTYKIYSQMRHEILNENNHQRVYEDILNFFDHSPIVDSIEQK